MIVVRRANERRHDRRGKQDLWLTFDARAQSDPLSRGFNGLQLLNEGCLPPGASRPSRLVDDAEIITYVREGALAYDDSLGRSGVLHAGEFRRMTAGRSVRCRETNTSSSDWVQVFQLWLRSQGSIQPGHEQKRFSVAQRRGQFYLIASPDARMGSLRLLVDALVFSVLLERGHHVVHDMPLGRGAWIHVVSGEASLGEVVLFAGDGAGVRGERPISLTARADAEILLVDLGQPLDEASWPSS